MCMTAMIQMASDVVTYITAYGNPFGNRRRAGGLNCLTTLTLIQEGPSWTISTRLLDRRVVPASVLQARAPVGKDRMPRKRTAARKRDPRRVASARAPRDHRIRCADPSDRTRAIRVRRSVIRSSDRRQDLAQHLSIDDPAHSHQATRLINLDRAVYRRRFEPHSSEPR